MSENENNFEELRRLLALKRHEIPPPRYFDNFSGEVIARIRAGEDAQGNVAGRFFQRAPWLLKLLQAVETKPAYSGVFASALCLLLLFGIVYAERPEFDSTSQALLQPAAQTISPFVVATATPALPQLASQSLMAMDNTNPVIALPAGASLFGSQPNPLFQQASYSPNGN
jgi:hypothetical protein